MHEGSSAPSGGAGVSIFIDLARAHPDSFVRDMLASLGRRERLPTAAEQAAAEDRRRAAEDAAPASRVPSAPWRAP